MDLFAATPLVFTLGIKIAQYYGEHSTEKPEPMWSFLNTPALWAAVLAIILNLNAIVAPFWLTGVLQKLSAVVAPLMLFSLGLALSFSVKNLRTIPYMLPVVFVKMILMPLFAIFIIGYLSLGYDHKAAAVLDIAMPSMVLGIVYCDRYKLDSSFYAMAVTVTTASSLIFLPFWHKVLMN
jgi:predicted permease